MDAPDVPQPAPIPPAVRWLMIVFLPTIGFLVGGIGLFAMLDPRSVAGVCGAVIFGGTVSAFGLLAVGLVVAPWLPSATVDPHAGTDQAAPAGHPEGSFLGPAATGLLGLGIGVAAGAALMHERYSYAYDSDVEPFTRPAIAALLFGTVGVGLFLAHQRHGPEVAPLARAPFHRVVFRCLLRSVVAGVLAGIAGFVMLWFTERWSRIDDVILPGLLGAAVVAAALTAAEVVSWRVPFRWRWPVLLGIGGALPIVIVMGVGFVIELLRRGDTLSVTNDLLRELGDAFVTSPKDVFGTMLAVAVPFALLGAGRTGLLPYFGRRAPWPLLAQVPLAWLAGALALALVHLLVEDIRQRDLTLFVTYLSAALPTLLVGMRLSDPLESRIAMRWVLLTANRDY